MVDRLACLVSFRLSVLSMPISHLPPSRMLGTERMCFCDILAIVSRSGSYLPPFYPWCCISLNLNLFFFQAIIKKMFKRIPFTDMREEAKLWKIGDGEPSEYWFSFKPNDSNPQLYWLQDTWTSRNRWVVAYRNKQTVPSGRVLLDLETYKKHGYFAFENVDGTIVPIYAYSS